LHIRGEWQDHRKIGGEATVSTRSVVGARLRLSTAVLGVGVLLCGTHANAQQPPLALNRFEPAPAGDPFFSVQSPGVGEHLTPHLMLLGDYAHNPLVLERVGGGDDERVGEVVAHQLHLHLSGTLGLFDWALVNVSVPLAVYQAGSDPTADGTTFESPQSAQLGDVRLTGRVRLLGSSDSALQLSLGGMLWLPTGSSDQGSFVGTGHVRGMPVALVGGIVGPWVWSFTTGAEFRPTQSYGDTTQGTMWHFGGGAGLLLGEHQELQVGPEVTVSLVLDDVRRRTTNSEALLGARYRFLDDFVAGVGVGPGLTSGIGTPDFRDVFSLAYSPKPARDSDGDGIEDAEDACPDTPGVPSEDPSQHGCPPSDRDGDGILDAEDACPDQPGVPNANPDLNGCPDSDGDGIPDAQDACPQEPGVGDPDPKLNGCPPDTDGDGIPNAQDACVETPGVENQDPKRHGCPPDTDGDGIPDAEDACVDVPGVATDDPETNGCPDRDRDGVLDNQDACPDKKGIRSEDPERNGCPVVKVTDGAIVILEKVLFDTNEATIKPVSSQILDQVAEVLEDNPDIQKVEVQGHTDNRGGYQHNIKLSQARSQAVVKALIDRGIEADRLTAKGFGPKVPIATNATDVGREKNRRVEFKILKREEK
jgi:OOP family OmpA-OmpF porin